MDGVGLADGDSLVPSGLWPGVAVGAGVVVDVGSGESVDMGSGVDSGVSVSTGVGSGVAVGDSEVGVSGVTRVSPVPHEIMNTAIIRMQIKIPVFFIVQTSQNMSWQR